MGVLVWVAAGAIVVSLALLGYLVVDFIRWEKLLDDNDELQLARLREVDLDILLIMLVAYLLVGLGIAIGRWDFGSGVQDEAIGVTFLLALAIAVVWPWLIWREAREASALHDRYD